MIVNFLSKMAVQWREWLGCQWYANGISLDIDKMMLFHCVFIAFSAHVESVVVVSWPAQESANQSQSAIVLMQTVASLRLPKLLDAKSSS